MSEHLDAQSVATLLASDDAMERGRVREHSRACPACRVLVDEIERAARLAAAPQPARALPDRLRNAFKDVTLDVESAESATDRLLKAGDRFDAVAAKLPKTLAVVRALTAAARDTIERDVTLAIRVGDVAIAMTGALRSVDRDLVALAKARALKEKALALRHAARYDEALATLDASDDALSDLASNEYDLAVNDLVRATIYGETERLEESIAIAERVERVSIAYADERMVNLCRFHLANIAAREENWQEAYHHYSRLLESTAFDELTRAALEQNRSQAAVKLGQHDAAAQHIEAARAIFEKLGLANEVARSNWVAARMSMNEGRFSTAVTMLRQSRESFLRHGLPEEAGLAGLDIAQCLVATGERDEARSLCRSVIEEFGRACLNRRSIEAVTLLHDHLDVAGAADVASVSEFIEALTNDPNLAMPTFFQDAGRGLPV